MVREWTDSPARRPWLNARPLGWAHLGVLAYLVLSFLLFSSAWRDPTHVAVGVGTDPIQTMWFLGWDSYAIQHGFNPFVTTHIDHPASVNLAWNNSALLWGLLLGPMVKWSPVLAWNLLMTASLPLSAWAAFAAIHRLAPTRPGAWVGGLLYGFSPFMITHSVAGHLSFAMAWLPPLALLLLHELLVRRLLPIVVVGTALGLLVAAQMYTAPELAVTTALITIFGLASLALIAGPQRGEFRTALRRLLPCVGIALVICSLLVAPLIRAIVGPGSLAGVYVQTPDVYVTDLLGLVLPTKLFLASSIWSQPIQFTGALSEWGSYVGPLLLSLLTWIAWRLREDRVVRWTAATAAATLVLSLGPHLHVNGEVLNVPLPMRLIEDAPLLQNVLPARLMLFFNLFAGLLVAACIQRVASFRRPLALASWITMALVALAPVVPVASTGADVPRFFTTGAVRAIPENSVALVAPYSDGWNSTVMLWQAASGYRFKMPEGYAIRNAEGNVSFNPPPSAVGQALEAIRKGQTAPAATDEMRCELARWHVRTVIVGPMHGQKEAIHLLSQVIGSPPEHQGGVWVWLRVSASC